MPLSYREIAEIIRILDASSCNELVVEDGDVRLCVRRQGANAPDPGAGSSGREAARAPETPPEAASTHPPRPARGAAEGGATPETSAPGAGARADGLVEIRSPMVGTFYRRPSPDAEPFVESGADIDEGAPLCLIEVMKLYTTIYATCAGRIAEVAVEDTQMVEYDQVLFLVEPR